MSKINFYTSALIGLIAIFFIVNELIQNAFMFNTFVIYLIILLGIGEFIAYTTTINIQNLIYIRSREECIETALPKIPFEVKKAFKFIPINLTLLAATVFSANYYLLDETMNFLWLIILFFPLTIHLISLIPYFMFRDTNFINLKKKELEDTDRHRVIVNIGKKLANKDSKFCRKTNTNQYKTILHYLNNGQNPDEVFEGRYTLILPSSCCGDEKLVKLLIERGSNVNFKSSLGMTALHLACKHGFYEIASLLIENGAYLNAEDTDGNTALFYAQKYGYKDIIELIKLKI